MVLSQKHSVDGLLRRADYQRTFIHKSNILKYGYSVLHIKSCAINNLSGLAYGRTERTTITIVSMMTTTVMIPTAIILPGSALVKSS